MKERYKLAYPIRPHGEFFEVKGVTMCISVKGSGDKIIVLLSGIASPSPIIEMEALTSFLIEKYTVVTLEYPGYGLSNPPKTERICKNIAEEIHEALNKLGFSRYSIAAHSISGVYSLYYANKYSNEIETIIGIDSSVPEQIDNKKMTGNLIAYAERNYNRKNSGFLWWIAGYTAKRLLRCSKDYKYSREDIKVYGLLSSLNLASKSVLEEYRNIPRNFGKIRDLKYPSNIPVLFILSKKSVRSYKDWYILHEEILGRNKGKIIILKGGHYLHLTQPQKVAEEMDEFINSIKQ